MLYRIIAIAILVFAIPDLCFSQEAIDVVSEYTYYTTESTSIEDAKRVALDRAKIQAIADAFGTHVSQSATTSISTNNNKTDAHFFIVGISDIKGEWIETLEQPIYSIKVDSPFVIVNCKVKGKIREIMHPEIELEARILKNGLTFDFESNDFKDGDDLYLYFKSSAIGNITVYLIQEQSVYRLLPYKRSPIGEYSVKADTDYVFFSKKYDKENAQIIDEYELFSDNEIESNQLLIIYTPNSIGSPSAKKQIYDEPLSTDIETFNKWMIKKRARDKYSRVLILPLTIRKS